MSVAAEVTRGESRAAAGYLGPRVSVHGVPRAVCLRRWSPQSPAAPE